MKSRKTEDVRRSRSASRSESNSDRITRAKERGRKPQGRKGPSGPAEKQEKAYTVRVSMPTALQFNLLRSGRKLREVGEEAVKLWMEKEKRLSGPAVEAGRALELRESLAETLIFAVIHQLRDNPAWANNAIQAASLLDPFISIYMQRVSHFREEKMELTRSFVPWFVSRALFYAESRDVILVIESGTTLKDALDELGPMLAARLVELETIKPRRIQIVTNNFPGAESYEAYASKKMGTERALGEIVPCHLVPGQALREYSAVVGTKAEEYLVDFCRKAKSAGPCICLGLVAGNWVMLEGNPVRPTPLARGEMHRKFKEAVLEVCEEAFLISPLGKMVQANSNKTEAEALDEFNQDFVDEARPEKGVYERVRPAGGIDSERLKLVTTIRTIAKSIVYPHSAIVGGLLRSGPRTDYESLVRKAIEEIPHFAYAHDLHSDAEVDEQLKIELPHEHTRAAAFRKKYFHVGL